MQLFLRLGKEQNIDQIITKVFVPTTKVNVVLYPIPTFIKDPTCKCGKPAEYLLEDMSPICHFCLDTILTVTSKLEEKPDTTIPINRATIQRLRFEWSPDKERWYAIKGASITPLHWDTFSERLKTSILEKHLLLVEGEYDKDLRTMRILV